MNEETRTHPQRAPGPLATAARWLAISGGLLMLGVGFLVVASVLSLRLTGDTIPGELELVQMATALAVFAFLPFCQARRANIVVDTFTAWLPDAVTRAVDAFWDLAYAAVAAVLAWRLAVGAAETTRAGTGTMILGLPVGWAIAACAAMAGFLALVAVATSARLLRDRP